MRTVRLYGHLAKRFGKIFRLNVATPGAAIRLLAANFEDFTGALREGSYKLIVGRRHGGAHLDLEQVEMNLGRADFHLVPVVAGARSNKGGALKAVLGVALVGAAIFFSGGTLAAPLSGLSAAIPGIGGVTYGSIAAIGLVTALAGISQLISPATKTDTSKKEDSFTLNGPGNVTEQGYPVPLIYGEVITGAIPVSSGYDVADIAIGT